MSRHSIKRIERIVGEINVYLVIVAIGLAMLDLVLLAALEMPLVPTLRPEPFEYLQHAREQSRVDSDICLPRPMRRASSATAT